MVFLLNSYFFLELTLSINYFLVVVLICTFLKLIYTLFLKNINYYSVLSIKNSLLCIHILCEKLIIRISIKLNKIKILYHTNSYSLTAILSSEQYSITNLFSLLHINIPIVLLLLISFMFLST